MARQVVRAVAREAGLSPREARVLELCAGGYGEERIAALLEVSVSCVRAHISNAGRKLREERQRQAVFSAVTESPQDSEWG